MSTKFDTAQLADLRNALGAMEGLAPMAPDYDAATARMPRRRHARPVVAVIGAVVVTFVVLIPALLLSGGEGAAPEQSSGQDTLTGVTTTPSDVSEQTPVTTTTSVVATTVALGDVTGAATGPWTVASLPGSGQAMGLTRLDEGFVALFYQDRGVEVWGSTEGSRWEHRGRIDSLLTVAEVVSFEGQIVAVGGSLTDTGSTEAVAWTSGDGGRTWDTVVLGGGFATDAAVTPNGFVAVGSVRGPDDPDVVISHAAVWLSDDGTTWRQGGVNDDPDGTSSYIEAVVWDGELKLFGTQGPHPLTEGSSREEPAAPGPVAWTSPDGVQWSAASPSNLEGFVTSAERSPFGIVATTYWTTSQIKDNSAVWVSADGIEWSKAELQDGGWEYTDTAEIDGSVRIVGFPTVASGLDGLPRLWTSTDGVQWTGAAIEGLPDRSRVQFVQASNNLVVVAGEDFEGAAIVVSGSIVSGE